MKAVFAPIIALCTVVLLSQEAQLLQVAHGPYLQELTQNGVTIMWTTNRPCVGRVEYGIDTPLQMAQTVRHGMINANTTHHAVRITGLKPGQKYAYRLVNTDIVKFGAYDTTLGETIKGNSSSFTTLSPAPAEFSFIVTQDIHSQAEKYASLLDKVNVGEATFVVLNGDMDNDPKQEDQIYSGHLDLSVERFAKEKPFVFVSGNHETRGAFARKLFDIYPHSSGRYYYSFSHGGVYFMVLASGEDKEDSHPVYAGLNEFDAYREEQAKWIEEELKSSAAKSAKYRIVFTHIPAYISLATREGRQTDHSTAMLSKLWAPLFVKGNVDLVISGHTHRHDWQQGDAKKGEYALLVGSNREIEMLRVTPKAIEIEVHSLSEVDKKYSVPSRSMR
ncbi:MAG: metallophosphoesterase family protein [Holophagales bacterium]|jgi:predicted phosphodiesterase|nr:metallophosphoesterase family protein [Holophagales bacterium]